MSTFVNDDILRKINETPELISILYDANLLPEQVTTKRDLIHMLAVVRAYDLGRGAR